MSLKNKPPANPRGFNISTQRNTEIADDINQDYWTLVIISLITLITTAIAYSLT